MSVRRRCLGPVVAVAVALVLTASPALGQDSSLISESPPERPVSTLDQPQLVGLETSVELAGITATQVVTLPATIESAWTSLSVRVEWPMNISGGRLEARDEGGRLGTLAAPADLSIPSPWTIPLRGRPGEATVVTLASTLELAGEHRCGPAVRDAVVRVYPVQLSQRGEAARDTIGTYLTGPISRLVLRVPNDVDRDIGEAALRLGTAAVATNLNRRLNVAIRDFGEPLGPPEPYSRVVTFDPDRPAGIELDASRSVGLTVGGRSQGVLDQVQLLTSQLVPLLQSATAQAGSQPGAARVRSDVLTLGELGVRNPSASGIGTFSIPLGFDQAGTGGQVSAVHVELRGSNAAVPADAAASATLTAGGQAVSTTRLTDSGQWRLSADVPPISVTRQLDLALQVQYNGSDGACVANAEPLLVTVDPTSSVSLARQRPFNPQGFRESPQMLLPRLTVVLTERTVPSLDLAARLLAGLQRTTKTPLVPSLASSATLPTDGSPSVVVAGASSALAGELRPAAVVDGTMAFAHPRGDSRVAMQPDGVLLMAGRLRSGRQAVALIGAASDPAGASRLLDALGDDPTSWFALSGDVATLAPDGTVVTAQVAPRLQSTLRAVGGALLDQAWIWALIGAAVTAAAGLVTHLLVRRRPRRPDDPRPETSDPRPEPSGPG